jgi:very-short-patch-repair endonuclease
LALDDALRKRMTTLERLWAELDATGGPGRKGSAVFHQLLGLRDDRDGSMESRLETATKRLLATSRLPVVTPQFRIFDGRSYIARLDFAYPHALLGVEAHSFRWHADLERWKRDQARDDKLKLLGWAVLHYTWDEVHFEKDRVIDEIQRMLARASPGLPI